MNEEGILQHNSGPLAGVHDHLALHSSVEPLANLFWTYFLVSKLLRNRFRTLRALSCDQRFLPNRIKILLGKHVKVLLHLPNFGFSDNFDGVFRGRLLAECLA